MWTAEIQVEMKKIMIIAVVNGIYANANEPKKFYVG